MVEKIPDLRAIDPLRTGITADTVALPDIIEALKSFNEQWGLFEKDLDTARLSHIASICSSMERLSRCLNYRVAGVKKMLRVQELDALEGKLKKAQDKRAERIVGLLKEQQSIYSEVSLIDSQEWLNKRVQKLRRRIQNKTEWPRNKALKAKAS